VQVGNNYFLNPVAGGTGPELNYSGSPVVTGEFSGWTPIDGEQRQPGQEERSPQSICRLDHRQQRQFPLIDRRDLS
jgi:hypothetical protein